MTAEEILARAADLLETRGWCQGVLEDEHGHLCLVEALGITLTKYRALRHVVCRAVDQEIGSGNFGAWNDAPGRTQDEVVTALRNSKRHL